MVRPAAHQPLGIDPHRAHLRRRKRLGRQRAKKGGGPLFPPLRHCLGATTQPPAIVRLALSPQIPVQCFIAFKPGHRDQMRAPKTAHAAFHTAFLVRPRFPWLTKFRLKEVVGTQCDKPIRFLSTSPSSPGTCTCGTKALPDNSPTSRRLRPTYRHTVDSAPR